VRVAHQTAALQNFVAGIRGEESSKEVEAQKSQNKVKEEVTATRGT
jgi:hypothetical protein